MLLTLLGEFVLVSEASQFVVMGHADDGCECSNEDCETERWPDKGDA